MASGSDWSFEKVKIKESEYSDKCGISGECYFWVSKGFIKITQVDNKTSVQYSVTKIRFVADIFCNLFEKLFDRNWGATTKTFFLDMGRRVPAGPGRLEMYHEVDIYLILKNYFINLKCILRTQTI